MDWSWRAIVVSVLCVGCGPSLVGDGDEAADDTAGTDGDPSDPSATVTDPTATATDPTATATDPSATATDPTATATDPTVTDPTFTGSATDPTTASATATVTATDVTTDPTDTSGGLPNGESCTDDSECESGYCYEISVLGSICGECEVDGDCPDGGCTPPNFLAQPPVGSVCNSGEYGGGCMSDLVCEPGLHCALVIDVPGIISASTCSECELDVDCDVGFLCAPDIAVIGNITGAKRCVAQGTLVNGQSCDFTTSGDSSCASGLCVPADLMGVLQIGVCSECEVDAECASQICKPPQVDLQMGLVPGVCG